MASPLVENWSCISGDDDFKGIEVSDINGGALLMSLLEESQGEEHDDEQLLSVIRSLEVEINPNIMLSHELISDGEDTQLYDLGYMDGHDCSTPLDLDFGWVDMEPAPSSPSDDMNWYIDIYGNEMNSMVELEGVSDYSEIYDGVPLEENRYSNSLWQYTYDTIMYD